MNVSRSHTTEDNVQNRSVETEAIECETKLDFLNTRFYFHDLFKKNSSTKHYIVEDMEYDLQFMGEQESHVFYYLKQNLYFKEKFFKAAKSYYTKLYDYCQSRFVKNDIVKMNFIYFYEDRKKNYFEIVTVYEYGETDRIDVDNIEPHHIHKFLKNFALLLQDLKKFKNISHNNLDIKNIILVNNELKISGFQPANLNIKKNMNKWRSEAISKYGYFRYDLFLMGLLWLKFLNINDEIPEEAKLEEVLKIVKIKINKIPQRNRIQTIIDLLDLKKKGDLTIEQIILQFDENYLLNTIEKKTKKKPQIKKIKKNKSIQSNLFMKSYRDSEDNYSNNIQEKKPEIKKKENFIRIGDEFTLRPVEDDQINDFITIRDIRGSTANLRANIIDQMEGVLFKPQVIGNRKSVDPNSDQIDKIMKSKNYSESNLLKLGNKIGENPFINIKKKVLEKKRQLEEDGVINEFMDKGQDDVLSFRDSSQKIPKIILTPNVDVFKKIESKINLEKILEEEGESRGDLQSSRYGNDENKKKDFKINDIKEIMEKEEEFDEKMKEDLKFFQKKNEIIQESNDEIVKKEEIIKEDLKINNNKKKKFNKKQKVSKSSYVRNLNKRKDFQEKLEKLEKLVDNKHKSKSNEKKIKSNKKIEKNKNRKKNKFNSERNVKSKKNNIFSINEFDSKRIGKNNKKHKKEENNIKEDLKEKINVIDIKIKKDNEKVNKLKKNQDNNFIETNGYKILEKEKSEKKITIETKKNDISKEKKKIKKENIIIEKQNIIKDKEEDDILNEENEDIVKKIEKAEKLIKKEKLKHLKNNQKKNIKLENNEEKVIEKIESIKKIDKNEINNLIKNQILQNKEKLIENEKQKNLSEFRRKQKELVEKMNKEKLLKEKELIDREIQRKEEIIRKLKEKRNLQEEKRKENEKKKLENAKKIMRNRRMLNNEENKEDINKIFEKIPNLIKDKEINLKKKSAEKNVVNDSEFFEDNLFKKEISEEARKMDLSSKKNIDIPKSFIKKSKRSFKKINKLNYSQKKKILEKKNLLKKNFEKKKLEKKNLNNKDLGIKSINEYKIENKFNDYNPIENQVYTPKEISKSRKYSTKFEYKKEIKNKNEKKMEFDDLNDSQDFDKKEITKNDFDQNNSNYRRKSQNISRDSSQNDSKNETSQNISNNLSHLNLSEDRSDNEQKEDYKKNDKTLLNIIFTKNKKKTRNRDNEKISIVDLSDFEDEVSRKKSYEKKIRKKRNRRNSGKSDLFSKDEVSCINIKENKNFDTKSRITKIQSKLRKEIKPEFEKTQFSTIYKENLKSLEKMLKAEKLDKALDLLYWMLEIEENQKKLDTFKTLGIIHYKKKQYEKSIIILFRGIKYLNSLNIPNKSAYKKTFLINIAISQIANNQPQNSLNCLLDPIFDDRINQPFAYLTLLGDSYFMINRYLDAFDAYNEQLGKFCKNILSEKLVEHIYTICNKIVRCLVRNKNEVLFVKFYKYLLDLVKRMIETEETCSGRKDYFFFRNTVFLNLIILVYQEKDESLLNYLLNNNVNDTVINAFELEALQQEKLLEILLDFTSMLKKIENYGNQKKSYGKILEYSLIVINSMKNAKELKKKQLLIFFNLGTFYLDNNDYFKAQIKIQNCLSLYEQNFGNTQQQLFTILYSIGEKVHLKRKYKESCFYFEKILEMESEKTIKTNSVKYLLKNYYILGEYTKGINLLEDSLLEKIEENEEDLFFFISIFFILCMKSHSDKFGNIMKALKSYNDFYQNYENMHYIFLYYNLSQYYFKKKNLYENKKILEEFTDLDKKKNFENKIVNKMDEIYNSIIMENSNENKNIFCCLFDNKLDFQQNAEKIQNFITNFYFIFINGIKIITKSIYTDDSREKILKNALNYKKKLNKQIEKKLKNYIKKTKKIDHIHEIGPIDVFYIGKSTRTVQSRIFSMRDIKEINKLMSKKNITLKTNTCKSINLSQSPEIKKKNFFKKNGSVKINFGSVKNNFGSKKHNKTDFIKNFGSTRNVKHSRKKSNNSIRSMRFSHNYSKSQNLGNSQNLRMSQNLLKTEEIFEFKGNCDCDEFVGKFNLLNKVVYSFFENLKDIVSFKSLKNIGFYYKKLILNLEQFNFKRLKKFVYIEKIVKFFELDKKTQKAHFINFIFPILDEDLCYHDIKNIFILLEANKNILLLEDFMILLEEKKENIFKKIIQKMFFEELDRIVIKIRNFFFKKIYHKKKQFIYSSSFYHLTNFPRLIKSLKIIFNFTMNKKKRFEIFNNNLINKILKNNFFEENLSKFNFNLNFFTSLLDLNKYKKSSEKVLKNYEKNIKKIFSEFSQVENPTKNLYDFYLLTNFIIYSENENLKIGEKIIDIISLLKNKTEIQYLYHVSIISSKIGNLLFSKKLYSATSKIKSIAFECLKKMDKSKIDFPKYINGISPKELLFEIFDFLFMSQIYSNEKNIAFKCLNKLKKFSYDESIDKMFLAKIKLFEYFYNIKFDEDFNGEIKKEIIFKNFQNGFLKDYLEGIYNIIKFMNGDKEGKKKYEIEIRFMRDIYKGLDC